MLFSSRSFCLPHPHYSPSRTLRLLRRGNTIWTALAVAALALGFGAPARAQRPVGIDVSSFQGSADSPPTNIVWTKVKAATNGITYAWAKATEGLTYIDADFNYNEVNGTAAGVYIGAYHFAHPDLNPGTAGADKEAAYFIATAGQYIKTNGLYLVPMLDAEVASPGTQAAVSQWVNEWCQDIVNYGASNGITLKPVVYTYQSWAADYLNSTVTNWPLWMASPNGDSPQTGAPTATTPWSTWTLWQYGQGTVSGVENAVDEDVFNGNATQFTNTFVIGQTNGSTTPPPPSGVTNLWDPGMLDASPGSGGSGSWDLATSNWWLKGTGDVAWSTAGDYAIFAGTSGTVTLAASVNVNSLTFSNSGYTIAGGSTVVMVSPGKIVVPSGGTETMSCVLGGVGFSLSGGGSLTLNNSGNYSAGETVTGPSTTLIVATDHDAGNDGVTLNLISGGTYQDNDSTANDQFLLPGSAVALGSGGGIFANPNANLAMTNWITGSGSLTYIGGTRTLTLSDTNSYTGGTIVISGTLKGGAGTTFGATTGALIVGGGTLDLGAATHTSGAVTITNGTLSDGTLTGTSYAGQGGTISANLAGIAALTKSTTNTLILSGTNTYTGITTISGGVLQISSDTNLGTAPGTVVTNQLTMTCGTNGNVGLRIAGNMTMNANRGITLNGGGAIQVAQNDTLTYNGVIAGSGGFEDGTSITVGYGTLILGGANKYTGPTTIAAGTLRLGANGALPSGTPLAVATADVVTGTFDLNSHSQTIGPLSSSTGIGGIGTNNTPATILLTGALTVLETNSTAFSGVISGAGGSLTVNGNSTLTLNDTNTYTGPTTISAGTLALGATGSINNSSAINIAAGATLDVSAIASYALSASTSLNAAGTASPATINGGTVVSLGSQPINLTYDGTDPSLIISQGALGLNGNAFTINNASGSPLGGGTYVLIQQATGSVSASGVFSVSITGSGVVPGGMASISVNGGNVNLVITTQAQASFSGLSSNQPVIYGTSGIFLGGQISAPGPVYPAMGESVSATINGIMQNTTTSDSNGDFTFAFTITGIPASGVPYPITYAYTGDAALIGTTNATTTLTINPLPVAVIGARPYDGTTTAAAAILTVTNKVGSDNVFLASGAGMLANSNAGPESITSFGTLALGGTSAVNYTFAGATGTVTITVPPFSITGANVDVSGSNFVITWQSVPGAVYNVTATTNVTTTLSTWPIVAGPITATGTTTSVTNPITPAESFFNVIGQ